ncbi:hypothetical protein H5410_034318 [Solanum commersonii]|uniref:Uncharacterized protein n=1 Tax=Solanum commersonii TaxID=4109 RepID=A0A9J5YV84_SOLCO|nr:hypothetical protein H5410_034318 [Solanum commersonii]
MELTYSKKLSPLFTGERKCQLNKHSKHLALSVLVGVEIPSKHLLFLSFKDTKNNYWDHSPDSCDGFIYYPQRPNYLGIFHGEGHYPLSPDKVFYHLQKNGSTLPHIISLTACISQYILHSWQHKWRDCRHLLEHPFLRYLNQNSQKFQPCQSLKSQLCQSLSFQPYQSLSYQLYEAPVTNFAKA